MFRKRHRSRESAQVVTTCETNECVVSVPEGCDCANQADNQCDNQPCAPVVCNTGQQCEARVITTRVMNECPSEAIDLGNKLIARIPVVLAETLIQIDVESVIQLEEQALEIKRVQKNVHVNQCKLLLGTNKLFISGFVRKNIEYATAGCVTGRGISGDIRHTTVNVPFECVTAINFCASDKNDKNNGKTTGKNKNDKNCFRPQFAFSIPGADSEIELLNNCLLGMNSRERDFVDFESFTEKPFCELIFAFITEADIECSNIPVLCNPNESTFQTLREKMVLNLLIKVMQNQQVKIPNASVVNPGVEEDDDDDGKDNNKNDGNKNNKN